ncbi:MAG: glucosamine-6-phosphate deaminase [Mastigocoleus sp.]
MPTANNSFQVDRLEVQVYESQIQLVQDVAEITRKYLQGTLEQKNNAAILFATGNSQLEFLDLLTSLNDIDWSQVTCFHLDEYLGIPANNSASFGYYLYEKVEKKIKPKKFNYIQGDTLEPLMECQRYTDLLKAQPIDLCFLGIGKNGHLAFNEPLVADDCDPYLVKLVKLDPLNRQQQFEQGHFPSLESVPQYAFTLSIPMIFAAQKIICFAMGTSKAEIIEKMLMGKISKNCPASLLRNQVQGSLYLDKDAGKKLSNIMSP